MTSLHGNGDGTGNAIHNETEFGFTPLSVDMASRIGGTGTAIGIGSKSDSHAQAETRSNLDSDAPMIDLKPMAVDLCTTMNFGGLPDTAIGKPYRHRSRFPLFVPESFVLEMSGGHRPGLVVPV